MNPSLLFLLLLCVPVWSSPVCTTLEIDDAASLHAPDIHAFFSKDARKHYIPIYFSHHNTLVGSLKWNETIDTFDLNWYQSIDFPATLYICRAESGPSITLVRDVDKKRITLEHRVRFGGNAMPFDEKIHRQRVRTPSLDEKTIDILSRDDEEVETRLLEEKIRNMLAEDEKERTTRETTPANIVQKSMVAIYLSVILSILVAVLVLVIALSARFRVRIRQQILESRS